MGASLSYMLCQTKSKCQLCLDLEKLEENMTCNFSFDGRVALVTGASSGIGAETARQLAASNCWLSLVGRNEENLKKVGEECQQKGIAKEKVLLIVADFAVDEDVRRVAKTTIDHFGKLDILINNAGMGAPGNILN